MKTTLSSFELSYIVRASYEILRESWKNKHSSDIAEFAALSEPAKTTFVAFVNLIIDNPNADLIETGFGLAWLTPEKNKVVIDAVRGLSQVFYGEEKENPIKNSFSSLQKAIQLDPSYAWAWHCNIAMPFMDSGKGVISHIQANHGAAWVMRHIFDVDTLSTPEFKGIEEQSKKINVFNVTQLDQSGTTTAIDDIAMLVSNNNIRGSSDETTAMNELVNHTPARGETKTHQAVDELPFAITPSNDNE